MNGDLEGLKATLALLLPLHAGAGDCFTAAFMVGLLEGSSTAQAMRFAAAAASICVSRAGAQPSLPSRQELDDLLSRMP
jgi:ribokinase